MQKIKKMHQIAINALTHNLTGELMREVWTPNMLKAIALHAKDLAYYADKAYDSEMANQPRRVHDDLP